MHAQSIHPSSPIFRPEGPRSFGCGCDLAQCPCLPCNPFHFGGVLSNDQNLPHIKVRAYAIDAELELVISLVPN